MAAAWRSSPKKAELLTQMDGLLSSGGSGSGGGGSDDDRGSGAGGGSGVMVLAATNCPWDLDDALLRRLEKRIHIPLPAEESIREMLRIHLKDVECDPDLDLDDVARRMAGFSGADVKLCCRDASMMPLRRIASDKSPDEIKRLKESGALDRIPLTSVDFDTALSNTRPSVPAESLERYRAWELEFASSV